MTTRRALSSLPLVVAILIVGLTSAAAAAEVAPPAESVVERRQRAGQLAVKSETLISACLKANDVSKALESARETHALLNRELGDDAWGTILFGRIALELSRVKDFSTSDQAVYCDCQKVRWDAEKSLSGPFDAARATQQLQGRLALLKQSLGTESVSYISTLLVLATVDALQEKNESTRDRFAEAVQLVEKTLGKQGPQYARALEGLGLAHLNLGAVTEAEKLLRDCLAVHERLSGKDSVEYMGNLLNLSLAQLELGKLVEAEESVQQTLKACAAHRDNKSTFYGGCIRQLGKIHLARKQTAEADACFEKAITAFEASARYSPVLAQLYELRATTLRTLERGDEAAALTAKAEAIHSFKRGGTKLR